MLQSIDKEMLDKYDIQFGYNDRLKEFYIYIGALSTTIFNCEINAYGADIDIKSKTACITLFRLAKTNITTIY